MVKCRNSIPLLGSTLSSNSMLFEKIVSESSKVVIAFDREKKAIERANNISRTLNEHGIFVRQVDLRRTKYGDMGEMTKEVAERFINDAKPFDSIMSRINKL